MPSTVITNPTTGTSYRVVVADGSWRITKSRLDGGQVRLAHMRGIEGVGIVDHAVVAALVAGNSISMVQMAPVGDVFAAVVLHDLERTGDLLTAIAQQARLTYEAGRPGFRPRSPALREAQDDAVAQAVGQMRSMAQAWRASGLQAGRELPAWMNAALDDQPGP